MHHEYKRPTCQLHFKILFFCFCFGGQQIACPILSLCQISSTSFEPTQAIMYYCQLLENWSWGFVLEWSPFTLFLGNFNRWRNYSWISRHNKMPTPNPNPTNGEMVRRRCWCSRHCYWSILNLKHACKPILGQKWFGIKPPSQTKVVLKIWYPSYSTIITTFTNAILDYVDMSSQFNILNYFVMFHPQ